MENQLLSQILQKATYVCSICGEIVPPKVKVKGIENCYFEVENVHYECRVPRGKTLIGDICCSCATVAKREQYKCTSHEKIKVYIRNVKRIKTYSTNAMWKENNKNKLAHKN